MILLTLWVVFHESHYNAATLFCTVAGPWSQAFFFCFAWYVMPSADLQNTCHSGPNDDVSKQKPRKTAFQKIYIFCFVSGLTVLVSFGFVYPLQIMGFHSVAKRWTSGVADGSLCDGLELQSCCCQGCTACVCPTWLFCHRVSSYMKFTCRLIACEIWKMAVS